MRIEQQSKNVYTKKPDKIEAHILRIIERFFETNKEAIEGTREEIIQETIRRIRQDTINSLRQIIIEEIRSSVNDEFGVLIDKRINDIILSIYQGVYTVPVIKTHEYMVTVDEYTHEIPIEGQGIAALKDNDVCDVFINGLLHKDFTIEQDDLGFVNKIVMADTDQLVPGDQVWVRFMSLYNPKSNQTSTTTEGGTP